MTHSFQRSNARAYETSRDPDRKRQAIMLGMYLAIVVLWLTCGVSVARSMDGDRIELRNVTESSVVTALHDRAPAPNRFVERFPKWVESFSVGAKICSYAFECVAVAVVIAVSLQLRKRCAHLPACKFGILLGAGTFLVGWCLSDWFLQLCGSSLITIAHSRQITGEACHTMRRAVGHWLRLRQKR